LAASFKDISLSHGSFSVSFLQDKVIKKNKKMGKTKTNLRSTILQL
jgi:hypothetical protein